MTVLIFQYILSLEIHVLFENGSAWTLGNSLFLYSASNSLLGQQLVSELGLTVFSQSLFLSGNSYELRLTNTD